MLRARHYSIHAKTHSENILKGEEIWQAPFHMHEKGRIVDSDRHVILMLLNYQIISLRLQTLLSIVSVFFVANYVFIIFLLNYI